MGDPTDASCVLYNSTTLNDEFPRLYDAPVAATSNHLASTANLTHGIFTQDIHWSPFMPVGPQSQMVDFTLIPVQDGGEISGFSTAAYQSDVAMSNLIPGQLEKEHFDPYFSNNLASQQFIPQLDVLVAPAPIGTEVRISCSFPPCKKAFKRDYERNRHEASVHGINRGLYLCPVPGCVKSQGTGYSRADK